MGVKYLKISPVGIDGKLNALQSYLYAKLNALWAATKGSALAYDAYGRIYKNDVNGTFKPEAFVGGKDYADVFGDDRLDALSFFHVSDTKKINQINFEANVEIYFFVNLSKIYPAIIHRADSEVQMAVEKLFKKEPYSFKMSAIQTGREIFNDFDFSNSDQQNMQPYHIFKIVGTIIFKNLNC